MSILTRYRMCADLRSPASAKLLYCYLLDISGGCHGSVVISVKNLAKSVGLSRSTTTSRNLSFLMHLDMIGIVSRYSEDGGRLANQYLLK